MGGMADLRRQTAERRKLAAQKSAEDIRREREATPALVLARIEALEEKVRDLGHQLGELETKAQQLEEQLTSK